MNIIKTSELKKGDIVRYSITTEEAYYMDWTVVECDDNNVVVHRPYIIMVEDSPKLSYEALTFSRTSSMKWVLKSFAR